MPRPRRPELEARAVLLRDAGASRSEVAEMLGVSVWTVTSWTQGKLIPPYDPSFLTIQTPFRAYFLGLFMADGWVEKRNLSAHVALNDQKLIRKIAAAIGYRNTIAKIPLRKWKSRELSGKFSYRISFAGQPLQELLFLGVTSEKTGNEFVPAGCDGDNFPHFLRGFSDGDGSMGLVMNRGKKRLQWSLVCSCRVFLETVMQQLHNQGLVARRVRVLRKSPPRGAKKPKKMFKIALGHADSIALGEYLYANASLKLDRKHEIWQTGRNIQTKHRNWSQQEIELVRQKICPPGRSKAAYYYMQKRIREEGF